MGSRLNRQIDDPDLCARMQVAAHYLEMLREAWPGDSMPASLDAALTVETYRAHGIWVDTGYTLGHPSQAGVMLARRAPGVDRRAGVASVEA